MCFKKKKKAVTVNSKFQLGDSVFFKYKDDLKFGYIYKINGTGDLVTYDIQIGGECPAIISNIPEDIIHAKEKKL